MNYQIKDIQNYLAKHYLTIEKLAELSGVNQAKILLYIQTQCIPPHSFEVSQSLSITSGLLNECVNEVVIKYYHPSLVSWIITAVKLNSECNLTEVAKKVRQDFNEKFETLFGTNITPGCQGLDCAWAYLMTGVWGICLKDITVENMAKKELSRLVISNLVESNAEQGLNLTEEQQLREAILNYESVVTEFAPHIKPISSRVREVNRAKALFLRDCINEVGI